MTIKVGINGFGRIGRQVYKAIRENYDGVLDVEAINDLMPVETNAHMLKYDSTYGRFPGKVEVRDGDMYIDGEMLKSYAERDPSQLPWGELGVDIVLECTGIFRDLLRRRQCQLIGFAFHKVIKRVVLDEMGLMLGCIFLFYTPLWLPDSGRLPAYRGDCAIALLARHYMARNGRLHP